MLGTDGRLFDPSFDFDGDGKLNGYEYAVMDDIVFGHDEPAEDGDFDEIDEDEFEFMDDDERREALEDAGLNPDDYDFD